ncbi:unnamed protein product [Closterium sp. NIES-54]
MSADWTCNANPQVDGWKGMYPPLSIFILIINRLSYCLWTVELLPMEGEQATAYNEAVEQYRRAVAARAGGGDREGKAKEEGEGGGEGEGGTAVVAAAVDAMPRRQLASIFTHLRKEEEEEEEGEGGKLGFDVLLTCYSLFERDSAAQRDDRKFLRRFRFSCVLMDEAHLLKDRSSQRAMKLRQLAQAADYRLMLTGTPLQNDLQELWSLLEFLMPAIFTAHQCDIAEYLGKRDQPSQKGGGGGPADEGLIGRMKAILGPFVLRRVKADVMKQLVAKVQKVELLPMEGEQATAYNEAVEQYRRAVAARAGGGDREGKAKEEGEGGGEGEGGTAVVAAAVDAMPRRQLASIFTHLRKALSTLLPKLKSDGHRVLLFSQWTAVLDILQHVMGLLGLTFLRLDGSTQVVQRQALVDEFNRDPSVFAMLLSTRAGGQGLNLTGADTVILHDVDFNPQMDRQAEDRCHRIGQTRPVTVVR